MKPNINLVNFPYTELPDQDHSMVIESRQHIDYGKGLLSEGAPGEASCFPGDSDRFPGGFAEAQVGACANILP